MLPWALDPYKLRRYPGPPLAAFSDFWLGYQARTGKRYEAVHAAHKKYGAPLYAWVFVSRCHVPTNRGNFIGKYVRIAPNNLSIADPDAIPVVYGHGTGTLKVASLLHVSYSLPTLTVIAFASPISMM